MLRTMGECGPFRRQASRRPLPRLVTARDEFPSDGVELTTLLVVAELERAVAFYRDVLGARLVRTYEGTSAVFSFQGAWLLLVTGGGPTPDKPTVTFVPPANLDRVTHELTLRVPDCRAAYRVLINRGAAFLADPVESDYEIRAFFRDPDGHLLEISQIK
jgi:catechol 2,3-dioxygenase-like lactoylglutathione lyase family enzyme